MLVFLAADAKRYEELDDAVRQYLAWRELAGTEERIRELELPPQQAAQARKRLKDADETVNLRISASYQWLLVPVQTTSSPLRIDELKADTNKDRLAERASERLKNADMLRVVQGPQNIRLNLDQHLSSVWSSGHIAVGKLWEYYCQYPYLPRLAERSVLENGILAVFNQAIWDQDGFAVASGYDEPSGQYIGLRIPNEDMPPQLSDTTLLVRPDRAIAQRERERAEQEAARAAAAAAARSWHRYRRHSARRHGHRCLAPSRVSGGAPVPGGGSMPGPFIPQRQHPARRPRPRRPAGPQEHPLLRHGPPRPGTLRPRHQPAVPGGHPAPRRPRGRGPGDHRRDHRLQEGRLPRRQDPHRLRERPHPEIRPVRLRRPLKPKTTDGLAHDGTRRPSPPLPPTPRRALPDTRLAEINRIAATMGDDPELDTLILRLHTEAACQARRRAGPARAGSGPGPVPDPAPGEGRDGPLAAGLPHLDGPTVRVVANILVTQTAGDPDSDTKFQLNESSSQGSRGHRSHA